MTNFTKHILFPFHEYLKGQSTVKMLRDIERTQWLSNKEIKELQQAKMKELAGAINSEVPFFRNNPFDPSDFSSVPFMTKKTIKDNTNAFCSQGSNRLVRGNTGGSSGEPLIFYLGKRRISADLAAKIRATRWWGVDVGDREVVIWGSPVEITKQDRVRQFRDWLFRTKLLSAFDMSDETMHEYLMFIREFRPRHVFGYPSSINLLCNYAGKKNIRLDDLGVKVVFCTAERLYDYQRDFIADAFSAPVANGYGSRDAGFIAHECTEGRMHIADEYVIVEIVDSEGNPVPCGATGEIVVTHLESHDFPFIRYRTGDMGTLSAERCPCGRGLSVLASVEGRSTDFIITPERKVLHGLALIYKVRDTEGVEAFKIVQEDYDLIRLFLVVNEKFTSAHEAAIRADWQKRLGGRVKIETVYQDAISPERSGKFRYVESKVKA